MRVHVIGFIHPVVGAESDFNTFRLGGFYAKCLLPGETIYLLSEREKIIFGSARVESIDVGRLDDMCRLHAHRNHTELANDPNGAPKRLYQTLSKIYGPHIVLPTKKATVIFLKRLE